MPEIGEIIKDGSHKRIWVACLDCGVERWIVTLRGKPTTLRCISCAAKLRPPPLRGSKHNSWKGGRTKSRDGYIEVRVYKGDFFYPMAHHNSYVAEHRLVMAQYLNRCLHRWEIVHHLNGIRDDNRIENLCLTMRQYHEKATMAKQLQERVNSLEAKVLILEAENILYKERVIES